MSFSHVQSILSVLSKCILQSISIHSENWVIPKIGHILKIASLLFHSHTICYHTLLCTNTPLSCGALTHVKRNRSSKSNSMKRQHHWLISQPPRHPPSSYRWKSLGFKKILSQKHLVRFEGRLGVWRNMKWKYWFSWRPAKWSYVTMWQLEITCSRNWRCTVSCLLLINFIENVKLMCFFVLNLSSRSWEVNFCEWMLLTFWQNINIRLIMIGFLEQKITKAAVDWNIWLLWKLENIKEW